MNGRDIRFSTFECLSDAGLLLRASLHETNRQNAPCAVFCHGFTGQRIGPHYIFVKISRALADIGVTSVRFDFSGSGESEGLFRDMHCGTMMSDLSTITAYVRDRLKPSRLIFLGHSFGGMVAARMAGPLGADGLILLSPVGDPQGISARRKTLLDAGPNSQGFYENGPHEMSIKFVRHLSGFNPVEEFASHFRGAALLVQGDKDQSIPVEESRRYVDEGRKAGIPVGYRVLQGADHNFSRVSDVTAVIGSISNWIKEHFDE